MHFVAILAAIVSFISPFWGLFLIVGLGAKYNAPKLNRVFWGVNFISLIAVVLIFRNQISLLNILDSFIGASLFGLIFFWAFNSSKSYTKAIFVVFLLSLIYSMVRNYLFSDEISKVVLNAYDTYVKLIENSYHGNKQNLMILKDLIWKTKNILLSYQVAVWNISEMFFFYLAILLMAKKREEPKKHKRFRMPYVSIYLVILFLILTIILHSKHIGYNLLLSITPLFIIQGFSILDYFWGDFFSRSKFLLILLILSLVLNTFVLILVAIIGLFDVWLDFRKIRYNN